MCLGDIYAYKNRNRQYSFHRDFKFPSSEGMLPVKLLTPIEISPMLVIPPSDEGIEPDNGLLCNQSTFKDLRLPNELGSDPVR